MNDKVRAELAKLQLKSSEKALPPRSHDAQEPEYHSAVIGRIERAGRAPYNFVPLAKGGWKPVAPPPPQDSYCGNSGAVEIHLKAETDFYIRGMQRLPDYDPENPATDPFQVERRMLLPGSSLRGMIRNLVEIIGKAPIHPINDDQLFFRSVAAVPDPANRTSFEPQAVAYKGRIGAAQRNSGVGLKVLPGFLYGSRDTCKWRIVPALQPHLYRTWANNKFWKRENITFRNEEFPMVTPAGPGNQGCAIYSGPMQGKKKQWVIANEDPNAKPIPIPAKDVEAYLESGRVQVQDLGLSQEERKVMSAPQLQARRAAVQREFSYSDTTQGGPCFYVEWTFEGVRHVSFGHTPHFRLPYQRSTAMAVPDKWKRTPENAAQWDIAQAMFGRVPVPLPGENKELKTGRRGRLFFEDATLIRGRQDNRAISVVLGSPKPTTYQHYLVQPSEEIQNAIHWDGDYKASADKQPVIRGHKLYWHRPEVVIREALKSTVTSDMRRGLKGAEFRARVRYENLSDAELGLLLTALQLPEGCAHRLGMGKPLGLGSFRITISGVREINRRQRYESFCAPLQDSVCAFETGETPASPQRLTELKESFSSTWYSCPASNLWNDPRLLELKALLTFDDLPPGWAGRTRYLEFGKIVEEGKNRSYNEYQEIGYPGRRQLQKRRPLPPATQVLKNNPPVPSDERPDFK